MNIKNDGYKVYESICNGEVSAEDTVSILEDSELKGLGGADFLLGVSGGFSEINKRLDFLQNIDRVSLDI